MEDKDSLYFSFDEEPEAGESPEEETKGEEGQNRTFLYGAIALAAVFLIGICAVIGFIIYRNSQTTSTGPSANELTNQAVGTIVAQTQAADVQTLSAPTRTPTLTPRPASPTPTSGVAVTAITPGATISETQGGIVEVTASGGTAVAQVASPTPGLGGAAGTPTVTPTAGTSGIIEVTPIGGATVAAFSSPTPIVSGQPTGQGGPITSPTTQATLPQGGFGSSADLVGAGFLAMLLVAVVFVARRIRLQRS